MNKHIQLIESHVKQGSRNFGRRGVAPVIATLLLVAIAVVGGSMIFVFAQDFYSQNQISGTPQPELVKIFGYDARDVSPLKMHDGLEIDPANCCGVSDGEKNPDERITIYIQNNSVSPITISELLLGGVEYHYATYLQLGPFQADPIGPQQGEYVIMTGPDGKPNGDILQAGNPKIESGQVVTLVLDLERTLVNARDVQVKLTTGSGNVFASTLMAGQDLS